MMALILLMVWGCAKFSSLEGQGHPMAEVKPIQNRFTKANNGVITDSVTGLDWYVGPDPDNTWHEAKCERKSNREPLVADQKGPTWFKK
jgi:hypothetical protein